MKRKLRAISSASFSPLAVVGLGYVGLPVACAFARKLPRVIGFDIDPERVGELRSGRDRTGEVARKDLRRRNFECTTDPARLREARTILITVPTPVDQRNEPDLAPVCRAAEIVGQNLSRGALVVLESTVYPGLTEEILRPILEKQSGLSLGDFALGYSPERINPGDKAHTLNKITKVVSGHDAGTLARVAALYSLVTPSVHCAPNIKTAEAAKVIENIQRDLNIALMNELSLIFRCLGLNTQEVLDAAATKWNFHRYHPGLVGGHCIGVDPYYLTYRAKQLGYHPAVILAGRAINDAMAAQVSQMIGEALTRAGKNSTRAQVLLLGLTFKENVPDIRNSKIAETIADLKKKGMDVRGCDPMLTGETIQKHFGINSVSLSSLLWDPSSCSCDVVVLVNAHRAFSRLSLAQLKRLMPKSPILLDLKGFFDRRRAERVGFFYQSL